MTSKILITGSSDGIGRAAAQLLASQGHVVYLHARNPQRAQEAHAAVPSATGVLTGDLSTIAGAKALAAEANALGRFDAVIHNAGIGPGVPASPTSDGFAATFAVNSLAPYILTSVMAKPKRLLYLSSSLHAGGSDDFATDITWSRRRPFESMQAYSDSKLHDVVLANAVARYWPDVQSCSMDPGWIRTKMGGDGAPGHVSTPAKALAEYAVGGSGVVGGETGVYFNPQGVRKPHEGAISEAKQDEFLGICEKLSGVAFPK